MRGLMLAAALTMAGASAEAVTYRYDYVGDPVVRKNKNTIVRNSLTVDFSGLSDQDGDGLIEFFIYTPGQNGRNVQNQVERTYFDATNTPLTLIVQGEDLYTTEDMFYAFFEFDLSYNLLYSESGIVFRGNPDIYYTHYGYYNPDGTLRGGDDYYDRVFKNRSENYAGNPVEWTRTLVSAAVPLPATAPMGILALAGLYLVRRRT